jgi:hypothetical protein
MKLHGLSPVEKIKKRTAKKTLGKLWEKIIAMNSVWERPDTHFLLAHTPQFGQAMGLHNQEPHNQCTKNNLLCVCEGCSANLNAHE